MMDIYAQANDPRFATYLCDCLNEFNGSTDMRRAAERLGTYLGQRVVFDSSPVDDVYPRIGRAYVPGCNFFFLLGVETPNILGLAVLGWIESRNRRHMTGFSRACDTVAMRALDHTPATMTPIADRVIIAGYSYGGACGLALGNMVKESYQQTRVSVVSFGAPKAGDDRNGLACRLVDNCRYMNVGDYCPFAPPTHMQAVIMHALLSDDESRNIDEFTQVRLGKLLASDCTISDAFYPPDPGRFSDLSLGNFLVNNDAPVAVNHALAEYLRRLNGWFVANPFIIRERAPVNLPNGNAVVAEPPIVGGAAAFGIGEMTIADLPLRPVQPVRQSLPYKTKKVGRLWTVQYQSNTVYVGRSKQDARVFCSRMNSAYTHWLSAPAGDADGLAASVHDAFLP